MALTPFYKYYPQEPKANLEWRLRCRDRAMSDLHFRHALYDACMTDVLFWMAFACWSVEPRAKVKIRPFVPWPHQEEVFIAMDKAIDDAAEQERSIDVLLDKSRAQGGTFGYLWIDLRRWLRDRMFSAGYVTRNEMLVDSATDNNTLFWKLAWGINRLPFWLMPAGFDMKKHRSLSNHTLLNPANGSTLVGYAAGQDVGAGGRATVFTCDEFGSRDFISGGKDASVMEELHDVTNCVAGGVLVLTDYGPMPIEKVELFHRVWDGNMWVSHDGSVYQGEQKTIPAYGIRLTRDHRVLTTKGWKHAGIAGFDREEIRLPEDCKRLDGRRSIASASSPRTEAVYDLLNCGPRRAFTVIDNHGLPLLIHNCIRLVSARYADSGVFHEACEDPDSNGLHLILDWKDNPHHAKYAYSVRDGKPRARDPDDQAAVDAYHKENPDLRRRLERKGFKYEGVVRSPWYDMRCLRPTSTPRLIASQLDRNPRGAVGKVFPTDLLDRTKREKCKAPVWQGTPVFDSETLALKGLLQRDDGPLKLWFRPGPDYSVPIGPFTFGCDIAMGSDGAYASNSVCSGIDDRTGEQVLEYTIKGMPAIKFARNVVGLAKWCHNAYLGWEDSGMAAPFAKEILEVLYYANVYYREVAEIGQRKQTRKAGWWNGKDEHKADLFERMALAMEVDEYIVRSADLVRECGEYEWEDGKIIHVPTKNHGAQERAHGDRCIAAGVAWLLYSKGQELISLDSDDETGQTPQYGSFLWREKQERTRVEGGSPAFGISDVVNT